MKIKTSITLSEEVLRAIDQISGESCNRSAFIELAVKTYLEIIRRSKRDQNDLQIINRLSEKLNREAIDVLHFQAEL